MRDLADRKGKHIVLVCLAFSAALAAPAAAGPLEQPEAPFHAGRVHETDRPTFYIPLRNVADRDVVIGRIEAGCHCSIPSLRDKRFTPGAMQHLAVQLDPQGLAGPLERTIALYEEGATSPALTVRYLVNIVPVFEALPDSVALGGTEPVTTVVRRNFGASSVTGVTVPQPWLSASWSRVAEGRWQVRVQGKPAPGAGMAVVTVWTDDPLRNAVPILVTPR